MNTKELKKYLGIIILNYRQILIKALYFVIYLALVICSSLIITLPIWYAATHYSNTYTLIVIVSLLIIFGLTIVKNIKKWIFLKQKEGNSISNIILIPLRKSGIFILFIFGLYGIIFAYTRGLFFTAFLLTVCYLLILGYFIFISRKHNESH